MVQIFCVVFYVCIKYHNIYSSISLDTINFLIINCCIATIFPWKNYYLISHKTSISWEQTALANKDGSGGIYYILLLWHTTMLPGSWNIYDLWCLHSIEFVIQYLWDFGSSSTNEVSTNLGQGISYMHDWLQHVCQEAYPIAGHTPRIATSSQLHHIWFAQGWKKARELTSSSPAHLHFCHYMVGAKSLMKVQIINAIMATLSAMMFRWAPDWWTKALNVMLEKSQVHLMLNFFISLCCLKQTSTITINGSAKQWCNWWKLCMG